MTPSRSAAPAGSDPTAPMTGSRRAALRRRGQGANLRRSSKASAALPDSGMASASAGGLAEDGRPVERADWSGGFPPGTECGEMKSVKDPQQRARGVEYVPAVGASDMTVWHRVWHNWAETRGTTRK